MSRHVRWLLIVLIAAAALRLAWLGGKSLWFDEAFSVAHASNSVERILAMDWERPESHPPLYYLGLHVWMQIAGQGETAVRLPSALISLLNVGLLYVLGRRLFGAQVALPAAALLAVAPLSVWYAQEARMYVFVTGVGLLSALLLTWNSWWLLPALTAVLTVGLYLDYTFLPLWTALSALWFAAWWHGEREKRPLLIWLIATSGAWLVFQPWTFHLYEVLASFNDVHIFLRLHETVGLPFLTPLEYLLVMALGGVALSVAVSFGWRRLQNPRVVAVLAPLAIGVFVAATLLFPLPRFYGLKRVLVVGWPYVVLGVAWLTARRWPHDARVGQGLMAISLAAALVALLLVPKDDWRGAVAHINQHATPPAEAESVTWLDPFWNIVPYDYYAPVVPGQRGNLQRLEAAARAGEVWLVAERFPGQEVPASSGEAWLDENLELVETVPFYRLEVRRYRQLTR